VIGPRPDAQPMQVITRHTLRESRIPLRVLLAEDNLVNQRVAVRLLEKEGHTVVVAGDGAKALEALERQAFDLILMDVQMPVMDGVETTAAIRKLEQSNGAHIPIVAMTAHAMAGDRQKFLSLGMDGYVSKPIHSRDLFDVIENVYAASRVS
jgi:two-component system sensor histidine kinase/response regulator